MTEKFNVELVLNNFLSALEEQEDVKLREYLCSYEELNKFCNLMGVVFGFVSKDLRLKMDILYQFLNDAQQSANFATVKKMIDYEMSNNLLTKKGYTSGSRTLLRLHRGLDFIRVFLKSVSELQDSDNTSAVCRAAYDQTLSQHHTFVVRNGARLAMHAMPTREQLLNKMCGEDKEEIRKAIEMLPRMLEMTSQVFNRIEDLYTLNNLHSLP